MTDLDISRAHVRQLAARVKDLEKEIEIKDEAHCQELRLMHKQLEAIMNKYCLN